jgi:hypothetical protein
MRAQPYADVLGDIVTGYWNDLALNDFYYDVLSTEAWVVTDRLNAETGENFSSWSEFYGPAGSYNGDSFTNVVISLVLSLT